MYWSSQLKKKSYRKGIEVSEKEMLGIRFLSTDGGMKCHLPS